MRKFCLFIFMFKLCAGTCWAGNDFLLSMLAKAKSMTNFLNVPTGPLEEDEKEKLKTYMLLTRDKIPQELKLDLYTRGLGYRGGMLRDLSLTERCYIRKNLAHLHILSFLMFINLDNLGLDDIPEDFIKFTSLSGLSLAKNNLSRVPETVKKLQKANAMLMLNVGENQIPEQEYLEHTKKAVESLFSRNQYSYVRLKDLEWDKEFVAAMAPEEGQEISVSGLETPNVNNFQAIFEYIFLCLSKAHHAERETWLNDKYNRQNLYDFFTQFTPIEALSYAAVYPDTIFSFSFFGSDFNEVRTLFVERVMDRLAECEKINVIGKKAFSPEHGQITVPEAVIGWSAFFNTEPLPQNKDVWMTAEGLRTLFDTLDLFEDQLLNKLNPEEQKAFRKFAQNRTIPFAIEEEIKGYRSIGFAEGKLRELSDDDQKWIHKNIDALSQLYFLRILNISGSKLKRLPDNFVEFTNLQLLDIRNNQFGAIPDVLAKMKARLTKLKIESLGNPWGEREPVRFDKLCAVERNAYIEKNLNKPNLDLAQLEWHPELVKRLQYGRIEPFTGKELTSKQRDAYNRKYLYVFFEFMCRVAAEKEVTLIEENRKTAIANDVMTSARTMHLPQAQALMSDMISAVKAIETKHAADNCNDDGEPMSIMDELVDAIKVVEKNHGIEESEHAEVQSIQPSKISNSAENVEWFNDNRMMIYSFLATHTPQQFIALCKKEDKFFEAILQEARLQSDNKIKLDELRKKTMPFFPLTTSFLVSDNKIATLIRLTSKKEARNKDEKKYAGWQSYFTKEPLQSYQAWYTDRGVAELLMCLMFVSPKE